MSEPSLADVAGGLRLLEHLAGSVDVGLAVLDAEARYRFVNPVLARIHGLPEGDHIGRPVADVISGEVGSRIAEAVDRVVAEGTTIRGIRSEIAGRTWEGTLLPLVLDGQRLVGVVVTDVTERDSALGAAQAEAARHARVADFSRLAVGPGRIGALFDESVGLLAGELDIELAAALELLPGGQEFALRAGVGFPVTTGALVKVPADRSTQAGYTLSADEPVVVTDMVAESRFGGPALFTELGVRSGVSVRVQAGAAAWGVLAVHSTRSRRFSPSDVALLRTIANVLGAAIARDADRLELERLALQRRRLVKEALESGERERRRMADVLHDDVLQHLLFARQECASVPHAIGEPALGRARTSLEEATRLLRDVVSDLHPVTLAHAGLHGTIEALTREHASRGRFTAGVRMAADLGTRHDQLAATSVRELLTNVVKHADATTVEVVIETSGEDLVIEVSDDGIGLDPAALRDAVAGGHVGLASLVERVEASGGRADLTTAWGGAGTRVRLVLPLT